MVLATCQNSRSQNLISIQLIVNALHFDTFVVNLFLSIVKLPELLACVNMEEEALAKLQQKLLDILR